MEDVITRPPDLLHIAWVDIEGIRRRYLDFADAAATCDEHDTPDG